MRKPTTPRERSRTVFQELRETLAPGALSLSILSRELGLPEKELTSYLQELQKAGKLTIQPAKCIKCGFLFTDRTKTHKPSKCPRCKSTYISAPEYKLKDGS